MRWSSGAPGPSCLRTLLLPPLHSESRERYRQRREEQGLDPDDGGNPNAWRGTDAEAHELMVYHTAILRNKQLLFNYV